MTEASVTCPKCGFVLSEAEKASMAVSLGILPVNHFRHEVMSYTPPSYFALEQEFGGSNVSVFYDGRRWTLDASCKDMDRNPGVRTFYVHDFKSSWQSQDAIVWGLTQRTEIAPNGYRPATPEEKLAFVRLHPEYRYLVALGASAMRRDSRYVSLLSRSVARRVLSGDTFAGTWNVWNLCLFVVR